MSFSERRGLGRGLGAIIREAAADEPMPVASSDFGGSGKAVDRDLIRRLTEVGLDLLEPYQLTHLGYLHQPVGLPPQLILRRPGLDELDPTTAYRLLAGLDRATNDLEHSRYTELDGAALAFIPSRGPHSAGVHLVGTDPPADASHLSALEANCRTAAQVVHQLHRELESDRMVDITTEKRSDRVVAHAVLRWEAADAGPAEGQGEADDLATAVARAMVAAHDNGLVHRVTRALDVDDDRHAVLTVLADQAGHPRLGFSVGEDAPVAIAASAARRAIRG